MNKLFYMALLTAQEQIAEVEAKAAQGLRESEETLRRMDE